ncbi:peptidase [Clostridia bacterium]|nr:peptidase [Clostridia bacterium]
MGPFVTFTIIIIVLIFIISCIRIVPQSQMYVIEKLGAFDTVWDTGIHFLIPFICRIAKKVSIKEQVADFKPQPVITKDNVTMQIDTVVFFQITDAKLYAYGVERPLSAIENLTSTSLRNIVGDLELDQTLTSRDVINSNITATLDRATDRWGIKVLRVELKNILPPREIQDAMEKQMKAERERREKILQAEGEKKSAILIAEGEKESKILRAEAEKATAVLKAEGEKEKKRLEAEGESISINLTQRALADSLIMLNESKPTDQVIALKALEAFKEAANGQATKIIIPSQIQGVAGLATSIKELL